MSFKARTDIHIARRIWHVCGVMTIFTLYWFVPPERASLTTIALGLPILILDVTRLLSRRMNKTLTWAFKPFMRECERHRLAALSFMVMGVTLTILLFPRNVTLLAILFLAWADPIASYFGIRFGKDKLVGNKSFQGTFAAFITCFILSFVFYYRMNLMHERLFIVCLVSALIGAASELIPVGKLDDNFIFPLASATLLTGVFKLFGGF